MNSIWICRGHIGKPRLGCDVCAEVARKNAITKFRLWQWVRVNESTDYENRVGRVTHPMTHACVVDLQNGQAMSFANEVLEPWTPRPGERVRIAKCREPSLVGSVGVYALGYNDSFHGLRVDGESPYSCENYLKSSTEFEPVFEEPEKPFKPGVTIFERQDVATAEIATGEPGQVLTYPGKWRDYDEVMTELAGITYTPRGTTEPIRFPVGTPERVVTGQAGLTERTHPEMPSRDELRKRRKESAREILNAKWEKKR